MGKGLDRLEDQLGDIKDDGVRYVKLRWASLRLSAVEKISTLLSRAFGYIIFLTLIFIALTFLMVALALWLGEVTGHMSLGFLVSGSAFLIAGAVIFLIRDRLAVNGIVRYFVDVFFNENDEENGTRQ